jgi:hypothetical protein
MQSNKTAARYPQCASRAQLQDEAQPRADTLSAPDNPHWGLKEQLHQLSDMQSHAMSFSVEVSNTSCTSQNSTSRHQNQSQTIYGGDTQLCHPNQKPHKLQDECCIYNRIVRCWISRTTGESVLKQRRMEIEYDLQVARDLEWQDTNYMEVSYYNGHWMHVGEAAELCCQEFHSQDDAYWAVDNEGCSNPKEQYRDVVQLLLQWLYASGPAAGFNL